MHDPAQDTTDQLAVFVLSGFRFILPDAGEASGGFAGFIGSVVE